MPRETKEMIIFIVRRDTECSECGRELGKGSFLYLENRRALCLSCADLDHLEYLPKGNTCITRRSRKYSKIQAVVVQ